MQNQPCLDPPPETVVGVDVDVAVGRCKPASLALDVAAPASNRRKYSSILFAPDRVLCSVPLIDLGAESDEEDADVGTVSDFDMQYPSVQACRTSVEGACRVMRVPQCEEREADVSLDQSSCVEVVNEETKEACDDAADEGRAMIGPSISSSASSELLIVKAKSVADADPSAPGETLCIDPSRVAVLVKR